MNEFRKALEEPLALLKTELNRLIDDFTGGFHSGGLAATCKSSGPSFNIRESENKYYLEADCPGFRIEDIELTMTGNHLSVSGERSSEYEEDVVFYRRERQTRHFSRVITLPGSVDAEHVEATLRNGVLRITLPRTPAGRPRKIEVQIE